MDKNLEQNMNALIAYSHTERFQSLWKDYQDIDYLTARSQIFLEIFNTFKQKLEMSDEDHVNNLIKLLTKREFFIALVNQGISSTMKDICEVLQIKEEIKESVKLPIFKVGEKEYDFFFKKAQESYMESNLYHANRHSLGDKFAKHTFYSHWKLLGEVFNRLMATEYVESLQHKNREEMPIIYKHTMSGEKFFLNEEQSEEKRVTKKSI